jgi:hypothetical protein
MISTTNTDAYALIRPAEMEGYHPTVIVAEKLADFTDVMRPGDTMVPLSVMAQAYLDKEEPEDESKDDGVLTAFETALLEASIRNLGDLGGKHKIIFKSAVPPHIRELIV